MDGGRANDHEACDCDCRCRSDRNDAGGGAGAGGRRRRHPRATRDSGSRGSACRRSVRAHARTARSAWDRRAVRRAGLRETLAELLQVDDARARIAASRSGLDVRYDLSHALEGGPHPLLGRRMPDLDLVTAEGPRTLYRFMHAARPLLLNLGEAGSIDIAPWADRVLRVDAGYAGSWVLPAIGQVAAPAAVLIRPDGHVAWVGDGTSRGLPRALDTWFGPPASSGVA
jgi:aromatic ring hydroxylase-like protein